jgi:hypothetical protein
MKKLCQEAVEAVEAADFAGESSHCTISGQHFSSILCKTSSNPVIFLIRKG